MHKDGTNPPSLDGCSNLRHVLQSLAAKRTAKMAKKYEQEWRLIEQLKQGLAGFRAVVVKHRCHWLRFTICGRLRHAPSIERSVAAFKAWFRHRRKQGGASPGLLDPYGLVVRTTVSHVVVAVSARVLMQTPLTILQKTTR